MRKTWLLAIPVVLGAAYIAGPAPAKPLYDTTMTVVPAAPAALEHYIRQQEAQHRIKPDNEARIVWFNDSLKQPTEYALVYLHGFSASQAEGAPTHTNIAKAFGCNLYLSRLAEHGIDTSDALVNLTADKYWESAKQALAIGRQLGKKVILMGTSTGASNALQLAATYPDAVAALILYSPNIEINDANAWVLNNHWGRQVAEMVLGSPYRVSEDTNALYKQYWSYKNRVEGIVALEEMLETAMIPATFKKIKQPALLLYYYKNEQEQDPVIKVSAAKRMFSELGTPASLKRAVAMPNTGNHVIASPIKSKDVEGVQRETISFMEEVLKMKPVTP